MTRSTSELACLTVQGPDRPGIVSVITTIIARHQGNIVSLNQHADGSPVGTFMQRIEFEHDGSVPTLDAIRVDLDEALGRLDLTWRLTDLSQPKRMIVLASKAGYCLLDLLWRQKQGLLPVTIPMVISNHRDLEESVQNFGVPYVHIPSSGPDKSAAEQEILERVDGQADFLVLARYMQILSADFLNRVTTPVINIHHSFLPSFIGADPYRQAQERGVKLIGATAHYVTEDLDEGPIIEQETARVTHSTSLEGLRARGAIVERSVLSRAVRWHAEDRVFRNGNHTIIFE